MLLIKNLVLFAHHKPLFHPLQKNSYRDFHFVFAHEFFHNWNGKKFLLKDDKGIPQTLFIEGFTNYYAYLFMLQTDLISEKEYAEIIETLISNHSTSPYKNLSFEELNARFLDDGALSEHLYDRGHLLAFYWNWKLKEMTSGKYTLDNVMRHLASTYTAHNHSVSVNDLLRIIQELSLSSFAEDLFRILSIKIGKFLTNLISPTFSYKIFRYRVMHNRDL